jgi:hypothetical protein
MAMKRFAGLNFQAAYALVLWLAKDSLSCAGFRSHR